MISEEMKNRIIKVAYGEANFIEKNKILSFINKDDEARKIYNSYSKTKSLISDLPRQKSPTWLNNKIKEKTSVEESGFSFFEKSPVFAIATLLLFVSLATFSYLKYSGIDANPLTREEVFTAEQETLASLKLVSNIFNNTKNNLIDNVIEKKISEPMNKSMNALEILTKKRGKK